MSNEQIDILNKKKEISIDKQKDTFIDEQIKMVYKYIYNYTQKYDDTKNDKNNDYLFYQMLHKIQYILSLNIDMSSNIRKYINKIDISDYYIKSLNIINNYINSEIKNKKLLEIDRMYNGISNYFKSFNEYIKIINDNNNNNNKLISYEYPLSKKLKGSNLSILSYLYPTLINSLFILVLDKYLISL